MFPGPLAPRTDNRGPIIVQGTWVMTAFAIVVVSLRCWARIRKLGKLQWDDGIMVAALVSLGRTLAGPANRSTDLLEIDTRHRGSLCHYLAGGLDRHGTAYLLPDASHVAGALHHHFRRGAL